MTDDKAWRLYGYVGRFVTDFASIENTVNQLFCDLIQGPAGLLLTHSLDLRKKVELLQVILKERGFDESKMFKRLHQLHNLRNVIAHYPFEQAGDDRLEFDYINKHYGTAFSKSPATSEPDRSITFAEFDLYHAFATELHNKLHDLLYSEDLFPVKPSDLETWRTMEEAISSSDNVVRFPEKPQIDDED